MIYRERHLIAQFKILQKWSFQRTRFKKNIILDYLEERKKKHRKTRRQMKQTDMASCNNCSLKEKEQVYTAARDGNLIYLKVSKKFLEPWKSKKFFLGFEPWKCASLHFADLSLPSNFKSHGGRAKKSQNFHHRTLKNFFLVVYFDSIFCRIFVWCDLNSSRNVIDFESICPVRLRLPKLKSSAIPFGLKLKKSSLCHCVCEFVRFSIISAEGYHFFSTISLCGNIFRRFFLPPTPLHPRCASVDVNFDIQFHTNETCVQRMIYENW